MPDTDNSQAPRLSIYSLENVPSDVRGGAVAIGSFDGVHRGHAVLIQTAMARARQVGGRAVILTFDPHPRTFFRPDTPVFRLTPPAAQMRILQALGIETIVTARFDLAFSQLAPSVFEKDVLADRLGARWVIVGTGFRFGKGRAGTTEQLTASGEELGYATEIVDPVVDEDGERISSSAIREALSSGDVRSADRLLGYRWFVQGTVIPGEKRGRELGFPTANISLPADCQLRHGIYAVTLTRKAGPPLPGVASFGRRPQFDAGPPLLEVFVFDFDDDLYGEEVVVTLYDWIRPERVFPTVDDLVTEMGKDVSAARSILSQAGPGSPLDRALVRVE